MSHRPDFSKKMRLVQAFSNCAILLACTKSLKKHLTTEKKAFRTGLTSSSIPFNLYQQQNNLHFFKKSKNSTGHFRHYTLSSLYSPSKSIQNKLTTSLKLSLKRKLRIVFAHVLAGVSIKMPPFAAERDPARPAHNLVELVAVIHLFLRKPAAL